VHAPGQAHVAPAPQVTEDPSEWMKDKPCWSYLPCLSQSVMGCVAALVSIGERETEYVRMQIPLTGPPEGPYTVTYQLDDGEGQTGACRQVSQDVLCTVGSRIVA
jgi:hypothetical protein